MAIIKSGNNTTDALLVESTSKAARIVAYNTEGIEIVPDRNSFMVAGSTTAAVAASLAANTTLMRLQAGTKSCYITSFKLWIYPVTIGASAGVPGFLALQRTVGSFAVSGGATRPIRGKLPTDVSTVAEVRDSNAALTTTGLNFNQILANSPVYKMAQGDCPAPWQLNMPDSPIVISPYAGLALRTSVVMPATQTWMYAYAMEWFEVS